MKLWAEVRVTSIYNQETKKWISSIILENAKYDGVANTRSKSIAEMLQHAKQGSGLKLKSVLIKRPVPKISKRRN